MKLLLIRPPFSVEKFYFPRFISEPLGIESLAAFLSPAHNIKVVDALAEGWNNYWESNDYPGIIFQGLKPKELLQKIRDYNPEAIGITWLFSTQNNGVDLTIKSIRKFSKTIPIIVGGPQPSSNQVETLKENKDIAIVVFGEGEVTLKEILDKKIKNLEHINGIAYRKNNEIVVNPPRQLIKGLDSLPIPSRQATFHRNYSKQFLYQSIHFRVKKLGLPQKSTIAITSQLSSVPFVHAFYYKLYNKRNRKSLPVADIITSRGCPNHCTFCAIHNIWGHGWRMRSAENVLEEIDMLVRKFGIKHINIQDDNFNVSKKRILEICKGIVNSKYNITFLPCSGSFVPALDEEVLTWLKKAGFHTLRMSIESGNQHILQNVIKKNIDLSKVKGIVDICRKLGIYTEGAFIFGIPGETIETMQETLEFAKKTGFDRIIKFIFQPFPNTELYNVCVKNNYLINDYDPQKAYITGRHCHVKTDKFSPQDVLKIIDS